MGGRMRLFAAIKQWGTVTIVKVSLDQLVGIFTFFIDGGGSNSSD
jgi:hypothetical protein